jgi:hypothetical protein
LGLLFSINVQRSKIQKAMCSGDCGSGKQGRSRLVEKLVSAQCWGVSFYKVYESYANGRGKA